MVYDIIWVRLVSGVRYGGLALLHFTLCSLHRFQQSSVPLSTHQHIIDHIPLHLLLPSPHSHPSWLPSLGFLFLWGCFCCFGWSFYFFMIPHMNKTVRYLYFLCHLKGVWQWRVKCLAKEFVWELVGYRNEQWKNNCTRPHECWK